MSRIDDPLLLPDIVPDDVLSSAQAYAGVIEQARIYLVFLAELEAGGLTHAEALWFTAQVWRAG
jgi:hypothetical protein